MLRYGQLQQTEINAASSTASSPSRRSKVERMRKKTTSSQKSSTPIIFGLPTASPSRRQPSPLKPAQQPLPTASSQTPSDQPARVLEEELATNEELAAAGHNQMFRDSMVYLIDCLSASRSSKILVKRTGELLERCRDVDFLLYLLSAGSDSLERVVRLFQEQKFSCAHLEILQIHRLFLGETKVCAMAGFWGVHSACLASGDVNIVTFACDNLILAFGHGSQVMDDDERREKLLSVILDIVAGVDEFPERIWHLTRLICKTAHGCPRPLLAQACLRLLQNSSPALLHLLEFESRRDPSVIIDSRDITPFLMETVQKSPTARGKQELLSAIECSLAAVGIMINCSTHDIHYRKQLATITGALMTTFEACQEIAGDQKIEDAEILQPLWYLGLHQAHLLAMILTTTTKTTTRSGGKGVTPEQRQKIKRTLDDFIKAHSISVGAELTDGDIDQEYVDRCRTLSSSLG